MSDQPSPRFVVFHSPGPNWQDGVDFREQPGVFDHVGHYAGFHEQAKLEMGGPFLTGQGGGMMIAAADVGQEELEAFAAADPAVTSGLLNYEVRPWLVAMTRRD
jgi:uncharacterized protein YciI